MSIEVMTAVWDYSTAYGGDLVMMLAIANYADINGRAYPSVKTLAQRGRMTERNAQYCIKKLEALGELKVERNAGPHGCHVFQIVLHGANFSGCKVFTHQKKRNRNKDLTQETGEKISGVQSFQTETGFRGGVKPVSPESSLDPSVKKDTPPTPSSGEPATSPQKLPRRRKVIREHPTHDPDGFKRFYAVYPKHTHLQDAIKAWDTQQPPTALRDVIIANVTSRAREDPEWLKDGGKYAPNPAAYLNNGRWSDEWKPQTPKRVPIN